MTKLPVLSAKQVIKVLERAGFVLRKSKGSHRTYVREARRVTVPYHTTDIKPGTLLSIIEQSGLSRDEFIALL